MVNPLKATSTPLIDGQHVVATLFAITNILLYNESVFSASDCGRTNLVLKAKFKREIFDSKEFVM